MHTFFWIVGTCLAGTLLSLLLAFVFLQKINNRALTNMVSLAVGTLLGAVFLELLPHALEMVTDFHDTMIIVLIGILVLFVLEKLLIWRHCHGIDCDNDSHDMKLEKNKKTSFVMIGDLFHNFIDGCIVAAAFLFDIRLGLVTALAIFAHEIPQELGNLSIFVKSGLKKSTAILFNLISNGALILGAIFAFFLVDYVENLLPTLLALASSSMIYVSISDLIPGLHKKTETIDSVMQVVMIFSGVFIIYVIHSFLH